jgi:hypothetical protein
VSTSGEDDPVETEEIKNNLCDDVRAFLLKRLAWNKLTPGQRDHLRQMNLSKRARRPNYLAVETSVDDVPPLAKAGRCNFGAEGVMAHVDEDCVHLAFKCGNAQHAFHYTTFGIDTVVALAKACEATWPGTVSRHLQQVRPTESQPQSPEEEEEDKLILDPGEDQEEWDDDDDD